MYEAKLRLERLHDDALQKKNATGTPSDTNQHADSKIVLPDNLAPDELEPTDLDLKKADSEIPQAPKADDQTPTAFVQDVPRAKKPNAKPWRSELRQAVRLSLRAFISIGIFSCVINLLMLAGPLFMLQVYDRVMTSGSIPTLIALAAMTAAIYAIIGILELTRARVITRIGLDFDGRVSDRVFLASMRQSMMNYKSSATPLRELDQVRQFLASNGPLTFFDAPWTPFYLLVILLMHWTLGIAAIAGAILLLGVALFGEFRTRGPMIESLKSAEKNMTLAEDGHRNAETIAAMGMMSTYRRLWQRSNQDTLAWQTLTADRLGSVSALSKTMRLLLQSMILGLGAYLAVNGEISAGTIVAATIIFGRALSPVEQAIGHWRNFLKTRDSFNHLEDLLAATPQTPEKTSLPAPRGELSISGLRVSAPGHRKLILADISFDLEPGKVLAVIGPSASGKSTLARALVGLWPTSKGSIRIDGARMDQWDADALGKHVGYLPQNIGLFPGTVRDNISRFSEDADDDEVITAAKRAHAHELILSLPNGYDTELGNQGAYLSGGQRQRIALARALFGDPQIMVLDEPNANLDRAGDNALSAAIDDMRRDNRAVIIVSHRIQAIGKADYLLYLNAGLQRAFGPRDDVLALFKQSTEKKNNGVDGV
ncbi:MAG: type I secretion system permease/ATPase [Hyphomicrobiaceae bacterium]